MNYRFFIFYVLFGCCLLKLYPSVDFVPKSREEVKVYVDMLQSTNQMSTMDEKLATLMKVVSSINFEKSCTCIKRAFFSILNDICEDALNADLNDIKKLNLFLHHLMSYSSSSNLYQKRICAFNWILNGRFNEPPMYLKQLIINEYQKRFECDVFVSLGNCNAGVILDVSKHVRSAYVIAYNNKSAKLKLAQKKKVQFILGDSVKNLFKIVKKLRSKNIFWVSNLNIKQTVSELDALLKCRAKSVILIDKAHLFSNSNLLDLERLVKHKNKNYIFEVRDNIIRIIIGF